MAANFAPRLDILPAPQRRLWPDLAEVPEAFVLYGGTAVALRLGHRQSIDFDFFAHEPIEPGRLLDSLELLRGGQVLQLTPNTLTVSVDRDGPVQLSFFGTPRLGRIRPPVPVGPIRIADLMDLCGTKAWVVQVRAEPKDYVDIDALLNSGIGIETLLAAGVALYGPAFSPQSCLKALAYFEEPGLEGLAADVKARLLASVRAADLDSLPDLAAVRPRDPG
jgi:hypothetical protein